MIDDFILLFFHSWICFSHVAKWRLLGSANHCHHYLDENSISNLWASRCLILTVELMSTWLNWTDTPNLHSRQWVKICQVLRPVPGSRGEPRMSACYDYVTVIWSSSLWILPTVNCGDTATNEKQSLHSVYCNHGGEVCPVSENGLKG